MTLPQPHPADAPDHALFELGGFAATPNALVALMLHGADPWDLLERHQSGDWGQLSEEDKEANREALQGGYGRLMSVYPLADEIIADGKAPVVWMITEADRSVTTLLLPEEY